MDIKYSEQAKKNLSLFYESYQDFNFFIEDEKKETLNAYLIIINKVFEERFSVKRVFSLGNKTRVLDVAMKNKNPKNYYIIDRDLDPYLDSYNDPKKIDNVIELERYCFENYLIEKKSFETTMGFYIDSDRIEDLYDKWISEVIESLEKIFKIALVSRKYHLSSCITDKEYAYLINNTYKICAEKLSSLYELKKSELEDKGENFERELEIVDHVLSGFNIKNQIISGKFLWASLMNFCKHIAKETNDGKGMVDKALFIGFVHSIELSNFDFLKEEVS